MFNRKYASRDRRKPRGLIAKEYMADMAAFKYQRQTPVDDVGFDAVDLGLIDDLMDEYLRTKIPSRLWLRYTTPQPFVQIQTQPDPWDKPWTKPYMRGTKMTKNPFRNPVEREAFRNLMRDTKREVLAKQKDALPVEPTFEQCVAKAGGKTVPVPHGRGDALAWAELGL